MIRALLLIFLFVPLNGLSGDTIAAPVFSYGKLSNSCGPVDQPTTFLRLTTRRVSCNAKLDAPYIGVQISHRLTVPATITIHEPTRETYTDNANRCLIDGKCEQAISGTVVFERARDGIIGHYDLKFKDGDALGTFHVEWCHQHVTCW
jgi:hypothetical protein